MLDKLTQIRPRSKRIVSRDRKLLFVNEKMAEDFGEPLGNGWFFGTNNNRQETGAWLERACKCAGLVWGKDFKTKGSQGRKSARQMFTRKLTPLGHGRKP